MALLEIAAVVNHHLVDLLVVLAGVIGVRGLRGQGVERHALKWSANCTSPVISAISSENYASSPRPCRLRTLASGRRRAAPRRPRTTRRQAM